MHAANITHVIDSRGFPVLLILAASAGCGGDDAGTTGGETGAATTAPSSTADSGGATTEQTTGSSSTTDADTEAGSSGTTGSTDGSESSSSSSGDPLEPQAQDDQYVVRMSQMPLLVEAADGLLANDIDARSVAGSDDVSLLGLSVAVSPDGAFTYTAPTTYWGGPDRFEYVLSDGQAPAGEASVDLLVIPDQVPLGAVAAGIHGFAIGLPFPENLTTAPVYDISSAGDVNADGLADILVRSIARAFVVFGKHDGETIDVDTISAGAGGGFLIDGAGTEEFADSLAAAGDVNGDGMDDLIIGAPGSDAAANNGGRAYVVFGKAGFAPVDVASLGAGGFVIQGDLAEDRVGEHVAGVGDFNGDGFAEVAITAGDAAPNGSNSGRVYVVFGKAGADPVNVSDVAVGVGGFRIDGDVQNAFAGRSLAPAGDVNGDLVPDLIVGSRALDPLAGEVHVVFGKSDGLPVLLDGSAQGTLTITAEDGPFAGTGNGVGPAGDVDGDGFADIVIGSQFRAYVVFGTDDTTTVDLDDVVSGVGGYLIDDGAGLGLGGQCDGGPDVNGDGVPDVIVGGSESAFVIYGRPDGGTVDTSDTVSGAAGFVLIGEHPDDFAGRTVAALGDVNGDGLADVALGAPGYPALGALGRAYVVFGTPTELR